MRQKRFVIDFKDSFLLKTDGGILEIGIKKVDKRNTVLLIRTGNNKLLKMKTYDTISGKVKTFSSNFVEISNRKR